MRICLVSAAFRPFPSGVSEHVYHLGLELSRQGNQVHILTTNYSSDSPDSLLLPQVTVTRLGRALILPANRSHFTLPVGIRIAHHVTAFFRRHEFDVVHCHGLFPPDIAYWALCAAAAPVVVTNHSLHGHPPLLLIKTVRTLFPQIERKVKAWIAVSMAARDWLARWFKGRYFVIPNGVDTTRFAPDIPPAVSVNRPMILYVGRLDRRKGLLLLLTAMPAILKSVPQVLLLVVGTGPQEQAARAICDRLGITTHVWFCGRVSEQDLPGYYTAATVYCSPALGGEAMGIVLLEAMASGRPVVASDIPGYNEVIQHDRNGLLFPANDPAALAAAVVRMLTDIPLRSRLAAAALERAAEFAWPTVAQRIAAVYRELV